MYTVYYSVHTNDLLAVTIDGDSQALLIILERLSEFTESCSHQGQNTSIDSLHLISGTAK
jgi:hypothetical protein